MRYFSTLLAFLLCFGFGSAAQAHVLEMDGPIHSVMHISPAHKPTATEPAHFEFLLMNTSGKFDPKAYAYSLQITGHGMATVTPSVRAEGTTLRVDYTFPQPGEGYAAILTGSSTVSGQPSFILNFDDIFVYPAGQHENPIENLLSDHIAHAVLVVLVIAAFLGIVAWDKFVVRRRQL